MAHIIFYDGVCGLCNRLNQFVLRRDKHDKFRFAALQSGFAREELGKRGKDPRDLDTVYVLSDEGKLYDRARAILFMLRELGGGWKLTAVFSILPTVILNLGYRLVARLRYRLFGKYDACTVPTAAQREKFLDA
jgi:predicted DCC family thiol-disulfide oxidoreductase YuxK